MDIIIGHYGTATVHATNLEEHAVSQIKMILDNQISINSNVCIMPDCHPGKVGPIGLTMTVTDRVIPNLLGVDIGCGMLMAKVSCKHIEYQKLDKVIREAIPSGFNIRKSVHSKASGDVLEPLFCKAHINEDKALRSIGTLGGGNHFIEIDKGSDGYYIVIHSGSRHLGMEVTEYYNRLGRRDDTPYEMTYLVDDLMEQYLHDVKVVTGFASLNREIILAEILKGMKWKCEETKESVHNYYGTLPGGGLILRKGAASSRAGEFVIIPINMRDGVIIGEGKGSFFWNYSAPHGSGRKIKRSEVQNGYTVSAFKKDMKGIYSSSISADTLDEAPVAYRGIDEIMSVVGGTIKVKEVLKPVYNFKAGNER